MPVVKKMVPRKQGPAESEIELPDTLPQYFVDGVAATQLGPHYSKITFHNTSASGRGKGRRRATHTLVIPTVVLLQYLRNLRGLVARAAPQLKAAQGELDRLLQSSLSDAPPVPRPKGKVH